MRRACKVKQLSIQPRQQRHVICEALAMHQAKDIRHCFPYLQQLSFGQQQLGCPFSDSQSLKQQCLLESLITVPSLRVR